MKQREAKTKSTLLNSQQKWTNFAWDIIAIAKKLMSVVDGSGAVQNINSVVYKSMKDKLAKYESVLVNIVNEIQENKA